MVPMEKPHPLPVSSSSANQSNRRAIRTSRARPGFGRCQNLAIQSRKPFTGWSHVVQIEHAVFPKINPAGDKRQNHRQPFGQLDEPIDPGVAIKLPPEEDAPRRAPLP